MKKLEIIDSFGDKIVVEPELALYATYDFMSNKMPGLCIQLYSYDEDGEKEPYATLTTNFGEFLSVKDCAYIDTNNCSFAKQLLEMGICQDTGFTKQSGFCVYPLWKFDNAFLRDIDVHDVYKTYEKKIDNYTMNGHDLPVEDREVEILEEVLSVLNVEDTEILLAVDDGVLTATVDGENLVGDEFYRYLLSEICEYDENGAVKGLELDLCNDFYDLCEYNEVDYHDYNKPKTRENVEYQIVMSSSGGVKEDFITCSSYEEAKEICDSYGWEFKDENEFVWSLNIYEQRKTAFCLSDEELCFVDDKEKMVDFVELSKKEFLASYSYLTEEEYDATLRVYSLKEKGSLNSKLADATERSAKTNSKDEPVKDEFVKE